MKKERKPPSGKASVKPDPNETIAVVLLTNTRKYDHIYAVSRSGGKTTLPYRAREFKSLVDAQTFVSRGYCPEGYVGTAAEIRRGERKTKPKRVTVRSAVARRDILPGQRSLLEDLP